MLLTVDWSALQSSFDVNSAYNLFLSKFLEIYNKELPVVKETIVFFLNRSCLTNFVKLLEYVRSYIDKGLPVDVIYSDFMKACEKVPHNRLMVRVKAHGIGGKIWGWIDDWLNGSMQRVTINGR